MKGKNFFKKSTAYIAVLAFGVSAAAPAAGCVEVQAAVGEEITINPELRYQTLKGWGTSLCWWGNTIGSWGEEDFNGNGIPDREEIAELAFSPDYLNLNIVRYNVGGGDKEDTSIKRCEGLVPGWSEDMTGTKDGSGEFEGDVFYGKATEDMADAGQLWMLEQANAYRQNEGDIINEVFSNSPPYYMTKSGSSTGGYSWDLNNLRDDQYDEFALYMARATKWIDQDLESKYGTGVSFIEPLNEPDTSYWQDGSTKQEGCIFNTGELQSKAYREMAEALDAQGFSDIQITGTDETALYNAINSFTRLDDDVKEKMTTIGAHTYSGNDNERKELRRIAQSYDKDLWMSEVTKGGGSHYNGCHESMDAGNTRSQSEGIMADLKYMQPTAWIAWLVADSEYECLQTNSNWGLLHAVFEKDGPVPDYHSNLVNADGSRQEWVPEEGYWAVTKQFYTMMQYSKYLKAGYTMIEISDGNMCAAISPAGDELVVVAQNFGGDRETAVNLSRFPGASSAEIYRTSDSESCELVDTQEVAEGRIKLTLPGNSVSTVVVRTQNNEAICSLENFQKKVDADVVDPGKAWTAQTDKFTYEGLWGESDVNYGDGKYSTEENASVTFTFEGDQAVLYGTKAPEGAIVEVSVDGQSKGDISLNGSRKDGYAMLYDTGKLEEGMHTVTFMKAAGQGDKLIEVSYAKIITGEFTEEVSDAGEKDMLYFIDCNSPNSPIYQDISSKMDLLNKNPDQAYTKGSWGYRDTYGPYNGDSNDQYDTGWYAAAGQNIEYTFPLKAGTYQVSFGFKEWWNMSRSMKLTMTKEDVVTELGTSSTWEDGNPWNKDTYEIICETDGEVTFSVEKAESADPVLSFIQIQGQVKDISGENTEFTSLKLAVNMAEKMKNQQEANHCYTQESWEAVETALEQAAIVLKEGTASQTEVDQVFLDLITACNLAEYGVQKEGLKAAIEGAGSIMADTESLQQYTEESITKVREAILEAQNIYDLGDAAQNEVNTATTNLLTAVTYLLVKEEETRLGILIQSAEVLLEKKDAYTPSSVKVLEEILAYAKQTDKDAQASDTQRKDAYTKLAEAMTALVKKADKAELKNALDQAHAILVQTEKYIQSSLEGLAEKTERAQDIYEDEEADKIAVGEILKELIQEILQVRMLGDVDQNGRVDTLDAAKVLRYSAELEILTKEQSDAADVDRNGSPDISDAAAILQFAAEKIAVFGK
ncbi:MAG: glycoside hydrolase [Lachnospiraceae bacterium]|nr:glycoside hydrolase [Lachnospiraceae bacterium]